ncbi:MAG: enoyl-CoA hydratase [Actinomycetia bacterium]|nr:enoyl-CoA hydratase [Actinomycetes bacterium]
MGTTEELAGGTVLVSTDGPVRTITLNRPERRNALDLATMAAVSQLFSADPPADERVTVIRAAGPVFCAGIDLKERQSRGGTQPGESPIEGMLDLIQRYALPVVGVVQGDAIAGGNELALHCDLVVASSTARFGMSLAQIGLAPTWFLAQKIAEICGPVVGREMLLLGDPLPATRMADLGMIYRAVEPDELESAAQTVIDRLAANAPLSLRAMKGLLVQHMSFRDSIDHTEVDALADAARVSADAREGIAARLERRAPDFKGE